jgi:hypothetical protein
MVGPNYTVYLVKRGYDYYEPQRFRLNGSSENFLNWEWTADLLPALKGEDPSGLFIGSPHLFGFTSVIWGAVGVVRDPPDIPRIFKALFLMFSFPMMSLSASKPHLGHFNLLSVLLQL